MTENLFTTSIPIYVIIPMCIGIVLIAIEIFVNTKGVLAVLGGIAEIAGLCLCFIGGVPIIEIVFLLIIFSIITMALLGIAGKNKKLADVEKIVTDFQKLLEVDTNESNEQDVPDEIKRKDLDCSNETIEIVQPQLVANENMESLPDIVPNIVEDIVEDILPDIIQDITASDNTENAVIKTTDDIKAEEKCDKSATKITTAKRKTKSIKTSAKGDVNINVISAQREGDDVI